MKNINYSMEKWLEEISRSGLINYELLPDFELYMEQLMTYMDKYFYEFQISSYDKIITPSMVNNYVKDQVISAPFKKKYNREHIAQIAEVCFLKKTLQIQNVKKAIDVSYSNANTHDAYLNFQTKMNERIKQIALETTEKLKEIPENDESGLTDLAIELAISASINQMISERIFEYMKIKETLEK